MQKGMVTVVIPSRNEQFLSPTIKEILEKAKGEIEVVAVLDGYWPPAEEIIDDNRLTYVHRGNHQGMRPGINAGVGIAKGEFVMKLDGHCILDEGFDEKLKADCEDNWVVIPRRKRLDAENWCEQDVGKPHIDYHFLSYPDDPNDFGGPGLNGKVWNQKAVDRRDDSKYDIDDEMSFQGSCWFMKRAYFYELELMDYENYGTFWNEAQEIGMKAWLSGGRVVRNKKTFYCHLHKGSKYGRGYTLDTRELVKGATFTKNWFFFKKAWDKQTKPLTWLIEHFWPVPSWPEDRNLWIPNPKPNEKK